jgi:hypothetical protein
MTSSRRGVMLVLTLVVVLVVAEPLLLRLHGAMVGSERPLVPSPDWGQPLLLWAATLAPFAIVGVLTAHVLRPRRILWWAATLGLVYGMLRYAIYDVHYAPTGDPVAVAILVSCLFAAPAAGVIIGALAYQWVDMRFARSGRRSIA